MSKEGGRPASGTPHGGRGCMAQTWPASVTTEPGVAGGAAAALLLVSYASELKALRWLPQFFFFILLYNFFKKSCP